MPLFFLSFMASLSPQDEAFALFGNYSLNVHIQKRRGDSVLLLVPRSKGFSHCPSSLNEQR